MQEEAYSHVLAASGAGLSPLSGALHTLTVPFITMSQGLNWY